MTIMNTIQPIQKLDSLEQLNSAKAQGSSSSPSIPFQSLYQDAITNAEQSNANLNNELYKMTTGQSDDLHNSLIASQKASLSVDMVVELRNKFLDAYKEIININV